MTSTAPSAPSTPAADPVPSAPSAPSATPAVRHLRTTTPLGEYVLAARGEALSGIWRIGQAHFPPPTQLGTESPSDPFLCRAADQLREYLSGTREELDLPTAAEGTAFQQAVWSQLRQIPRGQTTTYGAIARDLGRPRAAQAVGAAVGANPLSILVPCHRVLAADGRLTGYAGGVETKRTLLVLEGALQK